MAEGWGQGEKQAVEIFLSDLGRLERDIVGHGALPGALLRAGLVEQPKVAFQNQPVDGGRDSSASSATRRSASPTSPGWRGMHGAGRPAPALPAGSRTMLDSLTFVPAASEPTPDRWPDEGKLQFVHEPRKERAWPGFPAHLERSARARRASVSSPATLWLGSVSMAAIIRATEAPLDDGEFSSIVNHPLRRRGVWPACSAATTSIPPTRSRWTARQGCGFASMRRSTRTGGAPRRSGNVVLRPIPDLGRAVARRSKRIRAGHSGQLSTRRGHGHRCRRHRLRPDPR